MVMRPNLRVPAPPLVAVRLVPHCMAPATGSGPVLVTVVPFKVPAHCAVEHTIATL